MRRNLVVLAFALLVNAAVSSPLRAQDAPPPAPAPEPAPPERWFDTADFSFVYTAGNSKSSTLGFKNKLWREWTSSRFELNAGGIRTDSTTISRFAVGTPTDYFVEKDEDSELTAAAYYLNGRYDQNLSADWFWFAGAGWWRPSSRSSVRSTDRYARPSVTRIRWAIFSGACGRSPGRSIRRACTTP
jgi:hypothetical protein